MNHNANLIRMANQIGLFFDSMPDAQEGRRDLATHIRKFWDPRMRRAFLEQIDQDGGQDLSAIVRQAVQEHRAMLEPEPVRPA